MPLTRHDVKIVVNQSLNSPSPHHPFWNQTNRFFQFGETKLHVDTLDHKNNLDSVGGASQIVRSLESTLDKELEKQARILASINVKNMTKEDWDYLRMQMPKMEPLANK
jgi:hypothetical protein